MITFKTSKLIDARADFIRSFLLNVENYNSFIDWCSILIKKKTNRSFLTNISIKKRIFSSNFDCLVNFDPISNVIEISGEKEFQFNFKAKWILTEIKNSTEVSFLINLNISLPFIEKIIKNSIDHQINKTVNKFINGMKKFKISHNQLEITQSTKLVPE